MDAHGNFGIVVLIQQIFKKFTVEFTSYFAIYEKNKKGIDIFLKYKYN